MSDVIEGFIEVELTSDENFLKIKETLTRIGIPSRKEKKLFQSCHILHKKGRFYIVHFLEMFKLDGKDSHFTDEDKLRRNRIASLLEEWGLLTIINKNLITEKIAMNKIKVIPFKEKKNWQCISKYNIGRK